MCVSVHIFQKPFCPVIFRQMIRERPNLYDGLPLSTACLMQNDSSQIPTLSAKNAPTCAGVRPSSPYYRVRMIKDWKTVFPDLVTGRGLSGKELFFYQEIIENQCTVVKI